MNRLNPFSAVAFCACVLMSMAATPAEGSAAESATDALTRLVETSGLPDEPLFDWSETMVSYAPCAGEGTDLSLLPGLNQVLAERFSLLTFDPAIHPTFRYVPVAFLDLDDRQQGDAFRNYLKTRNLIVNTVHGDVLAGIVLVNALYATGHLDTATEVFLRFVASADPHGVDRTTRALLPMMRARLGSALLFEALTEANLALGMELLHEEAGGLDRERYVGLISCALAHSEDLPFPQLLAGPWARSSESGSSAEQAEAEFGSCEALLGDPGAMREAFDRYQALIQQQPDRVDALLGEALGAIGRHAGQAGDPLSLGFLLKGHSTSEILRMLAEAGKLELALDESLDLGTVAIWAVNLPIGLVLAEVLEVQGLEARCAGRTIRVVASPGRTDPALHQPTVILALVVAIEPPELARETGEGTLRWNTFGVTLHYQGQIEAGRPAGRGKLLWDGTDYLLEGDFTGVHIDGDVRIQFQGLREFTGRFHRGLAHGPGRLLETSLGTLQEGDFSHGRFTGDGQHRLDSKVVYQGPMVDSRPHGRGRCSGARLTYDCEFDQGRLVAMAGVPVPR
jgi:hypothetical protein